MRKIVLEKLIFQNYLKTSLTSILIIEVALVLMYFYSNSRMTQQSKQFILDELHKSTARMVVQQTRLLETKLLHIEDSSKLLLQGAQKDNVASFLSYSIDNDTALNAGFVLFNKTMHVSSLSSKKQFENDVTFINQNETKYSKDKVIWHEVMYEKELKLHALLPSYTHERLTSLVGFDVELNGFVQNILKMQLPFNGKTFLLNAKGNVLAKCEFQCEAQQLSTIFSRILKGQWRQRININQLPYYMYAHKLESFDWYVVSFVPQTKVLKELSLMEKQHEKLGYILIGGILLFYGIFFLFLIKKAKALVKIINVPITKIIKMTKHLGSNKDAQLVQTNNIKEFDDLCDNFNVLSMKLKERTQRLIDSESKRFISEELANTDPLTGVYNRRFLEDFAKQYIEIVKREEKTFSLMLMDIDHFKTFNDKFGHKVGDTVILRLMDLLKKTIRKNDVIVRLGGDEFVVVLPNTTIKNAEKVAKKITESLNFEKNAKNKYAFTVSIGLSQFEKLTDESIEDLLFKADTALYKAKNEGRNCFKV